MFQVLSILLYSHPSKLNTKTETSILLLSGKVPIHHDMKVKNLDLSQFLMGILSPFHLIITIDWRQKKSFVLSNKYLIIDLIQPEA